MNKIIQQDLLEVKKHLNKYSSKIKNKTFLITGGSGFIGSWFSDVVNIFGGKIICVDNLSSGSKNNINHLIGQKNFKFFKKDVCQFISKEKIDYVVHMASIATPAIYQKYPIETLDSNLLGTKKMLELALKNKVKGFLFTSTSEVYGNPEDKNIPTPEDYYGYVNSFGPRAMYDEGKRGAEAYCYSFSSKYAKMPIRIARIFNTYGPRLDIASTSQYGRALIKFCWQAINNKPITIYSDGKQTRAFCYITDQLEGLFNLLFWEEGVSLLVNIGNGREYSISELAQKIIKIADSSSQLVFGSPANYNLKDDPRRRCPNLDKAKKLLGYSAKISLDEGLQKTAAWLKDVYK